MARPRGRRAACGITPITSPPAASAASASAPISPTLRAAVDEPHAALGERAAERARRPRRTRGSAPAFEPQKTQTLDRAGTPASCQARPPRDLWPAPLRDGGDAGSTSPRCAASACSRLSRDGDQHRGEDRAERRRSPAPTRNAAWKPSVSATAGVALAARPARRSVRRVRDRGEDRQAERAADLLGRVDQARTPGPPRRGCDAGHRGDRHRHEREAEARRRRAATGTGCRRRSCRPARPARTSTRPTAVSSSPAISTGLKPTRVTSCEATPAETMIADRQRQVGEAGLRARRSRAPAACRAR